MREMKTKMNCIDLISGVPLTVIATGTDPVRFSPTAIRTAIGIGIATGTDPARRGSSAVFQDGLVSVRIQASFVP